MLAYMDSKYPFNPYVFPFLVQNNANLRPLKTIVKPFQNPFTPLSDPLRKGYERGVNEL